MPSRIVTFFHNSVVTQDRAAVGTAFDKAKGHTHDLLSGVDFGNRSFGARVEGITVEVSAIAGGATKLTVRMCLDADGDITVVPDVEATLATGLTTTTTGCVAYSVKVPVFQTVSGEDGSVYLFFKTNADTVTVARSRVTWTET
jgi:hypothetical protein